VLGSCRRATHWRAKRTPGKGHFRIPMIKRVSRPPRTLGGKGVISNMIEAKPDRRRRCEFGVAAADPAAREHAEGQDKHRRAAGEMPEDFRHGKAAGKGHNNEEKSER
jgi:hypothetical protein